MTSPFSWPEASLLLSLEGKTAIVTGAGAGLGRSIAFMLASAGAAVVVLDKDLPSAEKTSDYINKNGGKSFALVSNVADASTVEGVMDSVVNRFQNIDILVNNAGIYPGAKPIPNLDYGTFQRTLEVNLHGTFLYLCAAAKRMGSGGSIINISSNTSLRPPGPGIAHYCSSKAAVNALTRSAAVDMASLGIRVNAVLPGIVVTEGTSGMSNKHQSFLERTPSGRIGEPEDVAKAVLFLASPASEYINGQCLAVDGGSSILG